MSSEEYLLSLLTTPKDLSYAEATVINQKVCPFVKYYKDRLSVKYTGKGLVYSDITSVQSNKPANRDAIIYYYEVKINDIGSRGDISVGLADAEFPLNKHPGWTRKSYGYRSDGKAFWAKNPQEIPLPKFATGSIVGCGINYFKKEIFFTFNGKYYGPVFKDVELKEYYATLGLHSPNEYVTFNFGAKPFKFDLEKLVLEDKQDSIQRILKQPIDHYTIHQIVHSYLLFHGYSQTLESFEKAAQIDRKDTKLPKIEAMEMKVIRKKSTKQIDKPDGDRLEDGDLEILLLKAGSKEEDMEIEYTKTNAELEEQAYQAAISERFRSNSFQIEFESPTFMARKDSNMSDVDNFTLNKETSVEPALIKKSSLNVDMSGGFSLGQNASNGANNSKSLGILEDSKTNGNELPKNNPYLLQERGVIRQLIQEGKIQDAFPVIKLVSPNLLEENPKINLMLHAQQYIEYIRSGDTLKAIEYAQNYLNQFDKETIYSLNAKGIPVQTSIENLIALICYTDPENSELGHFLKNDQRDLVADLINKEILKRMGIYEQSILDILMGHLSQMQEKIREQNSHYGEVFDFKRILG